MSKTFELCNMVRNRIIASQKIEIPADRIFISRPASIFVGEGPVIIIYPTKGVRRVHVGDDTFPDETYNKERIAFDVLIDDIYSNVYNTSAIETASRIKSAMEDAVFLEREEAVAELGTLGVDVYMYAPGESSTYQLESDMKSGSMVGMGTEVVIEIMEYWQREARPVFVKQQIAIIHTEESERTARRPK